GARWCPRARPRTGWSAWRSGGAVWRRCAGDSCRTLPVARLLPGHLPVGHEGRLAVAQDGVVHGVEGVVPARAVVRLHPDTEVEVLESLDRRHQLLAREITAGTLQPFHEHHGVDEALEAHEVGSRVREVLLQGGLI